MKIRFFQGSANSCKDSDRKKQSVHKTMDEFQSKEFGGDGDVRCEANRNKKKQTNQMVSPIVGVGFSTRRLNRKSKK